MMNFSESLSALPETNVHWKDFCDTVVRLGESTSYRKAIFHAISDYQEADAAQQPDHKNTIFQQMKAFRHTLRNGLQLARTPTAGFCRNLIRDWQCPWHFLRRADVAPTNNHGERLLRHCVIWRKLSHGTQSESGNRYFERISTLNMACRLQKKPAHLLLRRWCRLFGKGLLRLL